MIGSVSFWKRKLADTTLRLKIPSDHSKSDQHCFTKGSYSFCQSPDFAANLTINSQMGNTPISILLLSGFKALLHWYTDVLLNPMVQALAKWTGCSTKINPVPLNLVGFDQILSSSTAPEVTNESCGPVCSNKVQRSLT